MWSLNESKYTDKSRCLENIILIEAQSISFMS